MDNVGLHTAITAAVVFTYHFVRNETWFVIIHLQIGSKQTNAETHHISSRVQKWQIVSLKRCQMFSLLSLHRRTFAAQSQSDLVAALFVLCLINDNLTNTGASEHVLN